MPEFALEMRQVTKKYGPLRANDSVNLQVKPGTIHALAGENGAGKSTLMKILFGLEIPDQGSGGIFINDQRVIFSSPLDAIKKGIGMVQQHFALAGALSALDNIILGAEPTKAGLVDRDAASRELIKIAQDHLAVPWNETVETLSIGLQQRVEILKLLFRSANILILDEPTAVLTPQGTEVFFELLRKLKSQGRTIILITHKLGEVLSLCDHVTILRHGKVTGDFETKSLTREELVRSMIGRDIKSPEKKVPQPGALLLNIEKLTISKSTRGSLHGFDLKIREKEIVGIAGVEGNGQSALVEACLALTPFEGKIEFGGKALPASTRKIRDELKFGVISEDRHHQALWLDGSVAENLVIGFLKNFSFWGFLQYKKINAFSTSLLKRYEVKMNSVLQKISSLSGGNQQKVVVAREITLRKPKFLIASQPTRGVDVGAIEFIHRQILDLRDEGAGILLISSELEELCALSDRICVLYEGKAVAFFDGPDFDVKEIGRAMTAGLSS